MGFRKFGGWGTIGAQMATSSNRMAPPMLASQVMVGTRSQGADGKLWEAVRLGSGMVRWMRIEGVVPVRAAGGTPKAARGAPKKRGGGGRAAPQAKRVRYEDRVYDDDEDDEDDEYYDDDDDEAYGHPPPTAGRAQAPAPNGLSAANANANNGQQPSQPRPAPLPMRPPTLQHLREAAKQAGVPGFSRMSAQQLLKALS